MEQLDKQEKIFWYYQEVNSKSFAEQEARLRWMFKQARRRYGTAIIHILNIGIGNGWLEDWCKEQGWIVHSIDIVPETVARLQSKGIDAHVSDITSMPFDGGSMDVVFCGEVMEHLTPAVCSLGLDEIRRVLRRGGTFIGTTPHNENLPTAQVICGKCGNVSHPSGHLQSFSRASQREVLEAHGFRVRKQYISAFLRYSSQDWCGKIAMIPFSLIGRFGRGFYNTVCGFVCAG